MDVNKYKIENNDCQLYLEGINFSCDRNYGEGKEPSVAITLTDGKVFILNNESKISEGDKIIFRTVITLGSVAYLMAFLSNRGHSVETYQEALNFLNKTN